MAINGNMFALLEGDDVENLTSLSTAKAAVPPSAVENRREIRKKPLVSSQPPSAAEKRNGNGDKPLASFKFSSKPQRSSDHDRVRHVNGVKRSNDNGVKRYNGENVTRRSNRGGSDFRRNNGYRHDERPNGSLNRKQYEKRRDGEETTNGGDGWEVVGRRRPNGCDHDQSNVGETERCNRKDGKEYRIKRSNSGGNNRVDGGFNRGHRHAIAGEEKDNGKSSVLIEEPNAGSKGDDGVADEASKESRKNEEERRMAEREIEAKRMTLSQYEKKLQEKRKALESMKAQEQRKVTLDKDFESMQIIEKKNQETIFVKLYSDNDKLKKKVTTHNSVDKITNFKIAGTNYTRRHSGRYRVEKGNVVEGVIKKAQGAPAPPSPHDAKEFPALGFAKELSAHAPNESIKDHQ